MLIKARRLMQVLVMFSQCRAFVYAQALKCEPRLCLKEPIFFSPDSNSLKFTVLYFRISHRKRTFNLKPFNTITFTKNQLHGF